MSEFDSKGPSPWTYYTSSNLTWPGSVDGESRLPRGVASPMYAFSFGFIATAILVSLFLVMAILEHLFGRTLLLLPRDASRVPPWKILCWQRNPGIHARWSMRKVWKLQ
ncbi:hypothetical protein MLD38_032235 [Melastoma candidum]|uniref:Uncharacterized protein n=1 Tax=Melastoma candidum TaxID=119954 RepID=A0ACB9M793_9MYRT|nr:hypothetical protein MLD38_032235 [Melastoma candidum]